MTDNPELSPKPVRGSRRRKRPRGSYEAPEMGAFLVRTAKALGRRAAGGELEALSAIATAQEALAEAMTVGARGAHEFGYTWTEIGDQLGTTRQNARQRFGGQ